MTTGIFKKRLEHLYQALLGYLLGFAVYIVFRGRVQDTDFVVMYHDPILILFGIFFVILLLYVIKVSVDQNVLIIMEDRIQVTSRFKTKEVLIQDMAKVRIGKQRLRRQPKVRQLVVIWVKGKKTPVLIRPQNYENSELLINAMRDVQTTVLGKGQNN